MADAMRSTHLTLPPLLLLLTARGASALQNGLGLTGPVLFALLQPPPLPPRLRRAFSSLITVMSDETSHHHTASPPISHECLPRGRQP